MDFYKNSLRSDRLMNGIYKKNSLKTMYIGLRTGYKIA